MVPENFIDLGWPPVTLIFFWSVVGLAVIAVLFTVWHFVTGDPYSVLPEVGAIFGWILAAVGGLVFILYSIPFGHYMNHYSVEGTVESVTNTFVEGSGEITSSPVVVLEEGLVLAVSDPRVLTLEGEDIRFTCSVEWVQNASDRYNCTIAEVLE